MAITRILAAILLLASCYNPSFPSGRPCTDEGECPGDLVCDQIDWICVTEDEAKCAEPPCETTVLRVPNKPNRDLDVLFMVDNSGSMQEEQSSLAANFSRFVNILSSLDGGLPNLHIGVISSDMGAGPFGITGCTGAGDDGALQSAPQAACDAPTGAFIQDIDSGSNRQRNYSGTLEEVFGCIARLGIDGCGFEQPLASIRAALDGSNPTNAGFLRPQAQLLIVILSDEDDCSVTDPNMFDTSQSSISDPLGPLNSFRCFEFGVQCDSGNDSVREPGPRQGCTDAATEYMAEVYEYAEAIKALKPDPEMIWVVGIFGDRDPVAVGLNSNGYPELAPSCISPAGEATPGVRLASFLEQFPLHHTFTTICNEDLSDALATAANLAIAGLGGRACVLVDVDLDPGTANVELSCRGYSVQSNGAETEIPECGPGETGSCYRLSFDPVNCSSSPNNLGVDLMHGSLPSPSSDFELRCLVNF